MSGRPDCGAVSSIVSPSSRVDAVDRTPLLDGAFVVDLDRDVHPGIDLVLDAEVLRSAHQNGHDALLAHPARPIAVAGSSWFRVDAMMPQEQQRGAPAIRPVRSLARSVPRWRRGSRLPGW